MQRHENILVFGKGKITYNPIMTEKDKPRKAGGKRTSKDNEHKLGLKTTEYYLITHSYPDSIFIASNADNTKRLHPTEKPLKLFMDLVKTYSHEKEIILDNTAGVFYHSNSLFRNQQKVYCNGARKGIL
jgi:site-specific DNA-methyltransferase (adenine-specific)